MFAAEDPTVFAERVAFAHNSRYVCVAIINLRVLL